jgi:hypothetical protein
MHLDEIVSLIHTLYAPNQNSDIILHVQKQLQIIQKEPDANILAHQLLQHSDQTVQYFGALTYTVYLTNHEINNKFSDLMADEVVDAFCKGLDLMVIQKLISNIGKIYSKILYSPLENLFQKLLNLKLDTVTILKLGLLSCKIIAEELNSNENLTTEQNNLIINSMLNQTTKNILNNSVPYLLPIDDINNNVDEKFKSSWLECLQAWVYYITKSEFSFQKTSDLNEYFTIVINLLNKNNDIESLNLISDIYDTCPSLLNFQNKKLLDNLIFSEWTNNFISSNDFDNLSKLSRFIALFLDSDMINLALKLIDPTYNKKFEYLIYLTNQPGNPIIDETFSVDLLEFWILFAEAFINESDTMFTMLKEDESKFNALTEKSKEYFLRLSTIYWNKAHLIDDLIDVEDEFISFRRDVGELFESLFVFSRNEIFNNLSSSIKNSLISLSSNNIGKNINDVDTSLYLLTLICSLLGENQTLDEFTNSLKVLFDSNFLLIIPSLSNNTSINKRHCQYLINNTIKFLSEVSWFYQNKNGQLYVKNVLVFLFQYLNISIYQESSSKAILLITDTCRSNLLELLDDFENAANSMIVNKFDVEINARSRIIRSYASILQTIPNMDLQSEKISNFLDVIYNESIKAYDSINCNKNNPQVLENIDNFLLSMISSLVGLAKGLQLPQDWEEYYDGKENKMNEVYNYWKYQDSNKFCVHKKCLKLILLYSFPNEILLDLQIIKNLNPVIIEQIYLFLKAGLTEPLPGPFVLEYESIIDFIIKCFQYAQTFNQSKTINSSLIKIIELYGIVIKSNQTSLTISKSVNLQLGIQDLRMNQVINEMFFKQLNKVINDTDILQYIFTLFADILARFPSNLIQNGGLIKIIEIAIDQLYQNNQQRFVIMAISKFWTNLIYLRKGKLEDINYFKNILINQNYGNLLVYSLLKGFINTSRSNLEFYCDIFRALTSKYGNYLNQWIMDSYNKLKIERMNENKSFIEEPLVREFVKKLILTRGQRVANRIIQEFWFSITGLLDYGTL